MGENSAISWTRHTFNPWWGCVKVSPGCAHCYAEAFAKRTGNQVWGKDAERRFFGMKHWGEPLKWDLAAARAGERHRVFCASMADWLEDRDDLVEPLAQLIDLIRVTKNLDWLLLTKRPENFMDRVVAAARLANVKWAGSIRHAVVDYVENWTQGTPPPNVWIGTTVEDQQRADERIPHLLAIPAKVRFLSCEPLLEAVTLGNNNPRLGRDYSLEGIHWCIVGGESGPGFRPFNPEWARSLRDQCQAAGVAFHMKQMGGLKPSMMPPIPDDLMIREFPKP